MENNIKKNSQNKRTSSLIIIEYPLRLYYDNEKHIYKNIELKKRWKKPKLYKIKFIKVFHHCSYTDI